MPEGALPITTVPILMYARVEGYDPAHHCLICSTRTSQGLGLPVRILSPGPCDPFRVQQYSLPLRGTWGIIAVMYGDVNAAFWLGGFFQSEINGYTQTSTTIPTSGTTDQGLDGQVDYQSHYSGTYSLLDGLGNFFKRFADGTTVQVAETNTPPIIYQHQIDQETLQQTIAQVQDADRTPNPPANPFYVTVNHPSGTQIIIAPDGTTTLNLPVGKTFDIGQPGYADALVLVSKFLAEFNTHVHQNVTTGQDITGVPALILTPPLVESDIIKITS